VALAAAAAKLLYWLYCCFTAALLTRGACRSGFHGSTLSTSRTTSSRALSLLSRKVLYCCFTAALLLLYWCFAAALLLLYCCFTAALLLLSPAALPPLAPEGVPLSLYLLYY
jgi:hypothetical protein